jgi:DNA polymerase/3'-5' exonuclease PolX
VSDLRHPRAAALAVAGELCRALKEHCEDGRMIVAGSLRRRKATVKDVEIVYVSKSIEIMDGLFDVKRMPAVDNHLIQLLGTGVLAMRKNVNGSTMWGAKNKLAVHVASGISVDLFATTEEAWFNYLVCRTGGKDSNTEIATRAQDMGWQWNPYGPGFSKRTGLGIATETMLSERAVFEFVGLPYREPWERA